MGEFVNVIGSGGQHVGDFADTLSAELGYDRAPLAAG